MTQIKLEVTLTLIGPVLTQSSAAGDLGVDSPIARLTTGECFLPYSLIKGRLRQSWDELKLPDADSWFGQPGLSMAIRGRLRFGDFVEQRTGEKDSSKRSPVRHRIRIDESTGAADDGALQVIESPFAAGQFITFLGDIRYFAASDEEAAQVEANVRKAFQWTTSFGAERTSGFGRVESVRVRTIDVEAEGIAHAASPPSTTPRASRFELDIRLDDPFCIARRRVDNNLFESEEVIPGSVIRGVLASTLNELLGHASSAKIDANAASGTSWEALAAHFNEVRFTCAFPSDSEKRPGVPPRSLVFAGNELFDVALCDGPGLIDGQAPRFAVDWKGHEADAARAELGWPGMAKRRTLRVRTAIDRKQRRASEGQLFAYETIAPDGLVWRACADLSDIAGSTERELVRQQLETVLAMKVAAFGKTKASGRVAMRPATTESSAHESAGAVDESGSRTWVLALQTPALLCNPALLNESSGRDELFSAYARVWRELSDDRLELVRYFAGETLAGGYLVYRFQHDKPYKPFLLTDAGSVFVLHERAGSNGDAAALIGTWAGKGLPLPKWAEEEYGTTWETNPFLPADGFGEIFVDDRHHKDRHPGSRFRLIERTPFHEVRLEAAKVTSGRRLEKVEAPAEREKEPCFNRWRIDGTITTITNFHLGSGEVTFLPTQLTREDPVTHQPEPIEISAVAIDAEGRGYIPGTSLKGSLRSWLRAEGKDSRLIESLFGSELRAGSKGGDGENDGFGGKVEFHDAFVDGIVQIENVPYWSAKRRTGVSASVAIDRWTRTASDQKLFHREYVPPGISFKVTVTGQNLEKDEVELLLTALRGFGSPASPVVLGAATRDGDGRFAWGSENIHRLDAAGFEAWLQNGGTGYGNLPDVSHEFAPPSPALTQRPVATFGLDISFDGPFLVNEPSRAKKKVEGDEPRSERDTEMERPDHAPRLDEKGRVLLPVSSFRGALRAQAEKIVRTLGGRACHSTDTKEACQHVAENSTKSAAAVGDAKCKPCITCKLFGAPGWASPISFSPFVLANEPMIIPQEFVAIDRFTGGVSGSAKFNAEAAWQPRFRGALSIDRSRLEEPAVGLLALALRDLAEGDVTLGFGASKGYGSCTAAVTWPEGVEAAVDRFHDAFPIIEDPGATNVSAVASTAGQRARTTMAAGQQSHVNQAPFHNPYHFVPVSRSSRPDDLPVADLDARKSGHVTHDRYASGTYSGRLLCRLTTESPVVIGAKQTDRDNLPKRVEPFVDPVTKEPAIPATSLRGLISSIAEAASNSALRVLNDSHFSTRREMGDSLGAIGMIVETSPDHYGLRPLSLPPLEEGMVNPEYTKMFDRAALRVYVNGYDKTKDKPPIVVLHHNSFLDRVRPLPYSADHQEFWYLPLGGATASLDPTTWKVTGNLYDKTTTRGVRWVLGLRSNQDPPVPIDERTYNSLSTAEQGQYTRGILRVLGVEGREKEMPTTKKHEIFIPYPEALGDVRSGPTFDATDAVAEFHRLADMRTESEPSLPYDLKGMSRDAKNRVRLRDGDLVFFKPTERGDLVQHVAISSIWRREVNGTARQFFERISPDLVPFNRRSRKKLTVAEQLFGFVEETEGSTVDTATSKPQVRALAGRLRFSTAFLDKLPPGSQSALLPPVPLKILSSPKTPSPALYFRKSSGSGYVSKQELSINGSAPQGRKFYLHQNPHGEPWRTNDPTLHTDQKNEVTPISPKSTFWFHVDFDNLSPRELGLLCFSVRPHETFRHKLGMGKPLGLGTVKIDPVGLFFVDRPLRYSSEWGNVRHHQCWVADVADSEWPERYVALRDSSRDQTINSAGFSDQFQRLRATFEAGIEPDIRRALELLGDPAKVVAPVHTPQVEGADLESETYLWFVENDDRKTRHQYLAPLTAASSTLPTLSGRKTEATRDDRPPRPSGPRAGGRPVSSVPRRQEPSPVSREPERPQPAPAVDQTWPAAVLTYEAGANMITARRAGGQTFATAHASFLGFEELKGRISGSQGKLEAAVTVRPREKGRPFAIVKVH